MATRAAISRISLCVGIGFVSAIWLAYVWSIWQRTGLFYYVGVDFSMFWAAGRAFLNAGPLAIYDLDHLAVMLEPVQEYYRSGYDLRVQPVPYPPAFTLLMLPFAVFPPAIGYALWVLANAGCGVYVAREVALRHRLNVYLAVFAVLVSLPFFTGLYFGQPTGFLLLLCYGMYRSLERGEDFRAGVCLAFLMMKPQLAIGMLAVILLKRRWQALEGVAMIQGIMIVSTFTVVGPRPMVEYVRTVLGYGQGFYEIATPTIAESMVSWRGILALYGSFTESSGMIATVALSVLTLALLPLIWRGPWLPAGNRFPLQMLATGIVTMLVGYDMHFHGAVVLIVPALIVVLGKQGPAVVRWVVIYAVFILPLFLDQPWFLALQLGPLLLVTLGALTIDLSVARRRPVSAQPAVI